VIVRVIAIVRVIMIVIVIEKAIDKVMCLPYLTHFPFDLILGNHKERDEILCCSIALHEVSSIFKTHKTHRQTHEKNQIHGGRKF